MRELIGEIDSLASEIFDKHDFENKKYGKKSVKKWEREVRSLKGDLIALGLLKRDSSKGDWELTEEGIKLVEDAIKTS